MKIPEIAASRVLEKIRTGEYSAKLSHQQYLKHYEGSPQYYQYLLSRQRLGLAPQSSFYITEAEVQQLLIDKAGTGIVGTTRKGDMLPIESIIADGIIGRTLSGYRWVDTNKARIYYGRYSSHVVPIGGINYG